MTTLELLKVTKAVWGSIRDASPEEKNDKSERYLLFADVHAVCMHSL